MEDAHWRAMQLFIQAQAQHVWRKSFASETLSYIVQALW